MKFSLSLGFFLALSTVLAAPYVEASVASDTRDLGALAIVMRELLS